MRRQALGRSTYHDGDRVARTEREDIGTRYFRDGTNAEQKQDITVEWQLEIGFCVRGIRLDSRLRCKRTESKKVWFDPGEELGKLGGFRRESSKRAAAWVIRPRKREAQK